ncbi:MAG: hypothetical protein KC503_00105 [Myxococcales bacterium]|nr:hypothetical protein [Myxococcales bacterium]
MTLSLTLTVGCGASNSGAPGGDNAGDEIICTGDVDKGLICKPRSEWWSCEQLPNAAKKCVRQDFPAPSGDGGWTCTHSGTTVTCVKNAPDAVGGGGWNCVSNGELAVTTCTSTTGPNGAGTSGGSSASGGGSGGSGGTTGGGSNGNPDGGGNWVCISKDGKTTCTSTHDNNLPPGGGSYTCVVDAEFAIVCTENSPPSSGGGGSGGGTGGGGSGGGGSTTPPGVPPLGGGSHECFCPRDPSKATALGGGPLAVVDTVDTTYNGKPAVYAQVTFSTGFNDNTYGVNSSPCWKDPSVKPAKGEHQFKQLVGSDAAELIFTCGGKKTIGAQIDYISPSSDASGYGTLCVSGGDGQMTAGDKAAVLGCQTSLGVNFNTFGYALTQDSPPFNDYKASPGFENWIYNVWYGVWVDKAALSGSCKVTIDYVHASPACGGSNSVDVVPCPCN